MSSPSPAVDEHFGGTSIAVHGDLVSGAAHPSITHLTLVFMYIGRVQCEGYGLHVQAQHDRIRRPPTHQSGQLLHLPRSSTIDSSLHPLPQCMCTADTGSIDAPSDSAGFTNRALSLYNDTVLYTSAHIQDMTTSPSSSSIQSKFHSIYFYNPLSHVISAGGGSAESWK